MDGMFGMDVMRGMLWHLRHAFTKNAKSVLPFWLIRAVYDEQMQGHGFQDQKGPALLNKYIAVLPRLHTPKSLPHRTLC